MSDMFTLDIVAKDLAMTFGSSFAEAFSSFTASSHVEGFLDECYFVRIQKANGKLYGKSKVFI